jgi:hypothetical protein
VTGSGLDDPELKAAERRTDVHHRRQLVAALGEQPRRGVS